MMASWSMSFGREEEGWGNPGMMPRFAARVPGRGVSAVERGW